MCLLASVCLLWRNIYVDLPCRFLFMLVPTLLLLCSVLGWSFCEEEGLSLKSCTWLSNTAAWGKLLSFSKSRFSRLWSGVHFINFVGAVWAYREKTHIMHLESGRYAVNMAFFSPVAPSVKSVSCSLVSDSATAWTVAHQAPLSVGFSRQEYWSGLPFPPPGDLPDPEIKPGSPALQADSLPSEPPRTSPYRP